MMWFTAVALWILLLEPNVSEATLERTAICNNDAIFAVDTSVIATSYDDVLNKINEQFLFKSFDIPVNGNNLSRAYRGHYATVVTRDEQTCLSDGFLGLIGDLAFGVSGRKNGDDDFVYDCGGCPEQDQLIKVDYREDSIGVFGVEDFLWLYIDGRLEEEIQLFPGFDQVFRNSDTLYLEPRVRVGDDRAFVIEYMPVCGDFHAWAAENVANSADRRCDTARSDNGTSFSFKGETCSLSCEEPYVMTSGPPDYNTVVSDTFTCTHDTDPEWEGVATCTQRCQDFSDWIDTQARNWPNIFMSNVQYAQSIPGASLSFTCSPGFETGDGTLLEFECDPRNAPEWTQVGLFTGCFAVPTRDNSTCGESDSSPAARTSPSTPPAIIAVVLSLAVARDQ